VKGNVQLGLNIAVTDPITGLHNRIFLIRHLQRLLESARLRDAPLSVLTVRPDVRETCTRQGETQTLRAIAAEISASLREGDLVCRNDATEFVVVMPNSSISGAIAAAERIRGALLTASRDRGHLANIGSAVSIGVAGLTGVGDNATALLARSAQAAEDAILTGSTGIATRAA
jgi:two-component system cell cycle response regulator